MVRINRTGIVLSMEWFTVCLEVLVLIQLFEFYSHQFNFDNATIPENNNDCY